MSLKGTTTTSDYLDYEKMMFKAMNMVNNEKTKVIGAYIIVAINTGLRCGDVLKLTYEDLLEITLMLTTPKRFKLTTLKRSILTTPKRSMLTT
jgi:integrase